MQRTAGATCTLNPNRERRGDTELNDKFDVCNIGSLSNIFSFPTLGKNKMRPSTMPAASVATRILIFPFRNCFMTRRFALAVR
jgi:hypothetical protein